jgi:PAS domain S-box-containing protein
MSEGISAVQGQYNIALVILSYCVAVIASHVTLELAGRLRDPLRRAPLLWLFGGALSMGTGIWSMHFIGMLAFDLPITVLYDLGLTTLSWAIAVLVSGFALHIVRRGVVGLRGLPLPGFFMGLGISAMHYTGMAAMQMSPPIQYDPLLFVLSVVIAIVASMAALWIAFNLSKARPNLLVLSKVGAALVMGSAIVGMHYTAMAAANFDPNSLCLARGPLLDVMWMAYSLASFTILFLTATILISIYDARLASALARSAQQLREANEELEQRVQERTINLAREEARKGAILTAALDCIISADAKGVVTEFNPAAESTFGYTRAEAVGQNLTDLIIPSENRAACATGLNRFLVTRRSQMIGSRIEVPVMRKNGECFPAELAILDVEVGGDVFLTAYLRDITARKEAELALQSAKEAAEAGSRAKSAFLATMSHEIRTPMNAMIGLLEVLSLSSLDAEQKDTVGLIRESSKSLLRLIDDILDFSKIEAGKLELHEEPTSLSRLVEHAAQIFSSVASGKGILFSRTIDPRIASAVWVDRLRLRQIINNFLSNAIKFTDRGQVELAVDLVGREQEHDVVSIAVRDTGVGMGPMARERLFKPFIQGDPDIERRFGGTGLGLAISKRLADLLGATIDVESAPHVGTRVSLTLSLRRATDAELREVQPETVEVIASQIRHRKRAPSVAEAAANGSLVLVVDDHPTNCRVLARQLGLLGFAVETAGNGQEALERWRRGGIGLLITDCQMPVMDGYALARSIRQAEADRAHGKKSPAPARLPIIAVTANTLAEAISACRDAGMDEVLTKPLELANLKRTVDRWVPVGVPEQAHEASAFDEAAIQALANGDKTIEDEVLEEYRQANDADLAAAAEAFAAAEFEDVRSAAHRIKGAARMIGAASLSEAAASLELAARSGDANSMQYAWATVQTESERLYTSIDARAAERTSIS